MDSKSTKSNANLPTESTMMSMVDNTETAEYDLKATRRLLRKLDWHLIPFLSLLYL